MTLRERGPYRYGDGQADIREELVRYSEGVSYLAHHFADAVCKCGETTFHLTLDEDAGVAVRECSACEEGHPIGDGADFLEGAELEGCACPCGNETFEITVGVSLYQESEDVKWFYLGCRCPA